MGLNRSSRPNRSGPIDHDVFEGLPVRRWIRQPTTFSQEPKQVEEEKSIVDTQSLPELPMPRDSHLLTPMSRALLRAARAGCTYIRPVRKAPEQPEETEQKDDEDTSAEQPVDERAFTAMKWTTVPRTVEPPEVEFLAPRRAGLPSLYGAGAQSNATKASGSSTPMRKTKFKKTDPTTGTISIYEAWVPEGYQVEGEIVQEAQVIAANPDAKVVNVDPAPGTVVANIGVVNQHGVVVATTGNSAVVPKQNKAKRKLKSGKSKSRKRVMFASGDGTGQPVAPGAEVSGNVTAAQSTVSENGATPSGTENAAEDEDEEDEEEGDESDEEGESSANSKSTSTAGASSNGNTATPVVDTPLDSQNIPSQPSVAEQVSIQRTSTAPPQGLSGTTEVLFATIPTSEQPFKSPTEILKDVTASTEALSASVPPTEPQQAKATDQPKISPPPATAVHDAKTGSPIAPVPKSLDIKTDTADGSHQPSPEKAVTPQAPTKEEQVSQPGLPSSSETEAKPRISPTPPTSDPMPGHVSGDLPIPSRPSSDEPTTSSLPQPPETTTESKPEPTSASAVRSEDGEVDLLGSLEASLDEKAESTAQNKPEDAPSALTEQKGGDTNTHSNIPSAKEGESNNDGKDVDMTG